MRTALLFALCALSSLVFVNSTNAGEPQGYVFGGFGEEAVVNFGGGGEYVFDNGFGIGAELGYLGALEDLSFGVGVLDISAIYHFKSKEESNTWVPFVTGGYTLLFRQSTANVWHLGAGLQYWKTDRSGFRLEFRNRILTEFGSHSYLLRAGYAFRL